MSDLSADLLGSLEKINFTAANEVAQALSQIMGISVDLIDHQAKLIELDKIPQFLNNTESVVTAVYFNVEGDFHANAVSLIERENVLSFIDLMNGQEIGSTQQLDELGESSIKELSNILWGSYISELCETFQIQLRPSVPYLSTDILSAVLDGILGSLSFDADSALLMGGVFRTENTKLSVTLLFFIDQNGLNLILASL